MTIQELLKQSKEIDARIAAIRAEITKIDDGEHTAEVDALLDQEDELQREGMAVAREMIKAQAAR